MISAPPLLYLDHRSRASTHLFSSEGFGTGDAETSLGYDNLATDKDTLTSPVSKNSLVSKNSTSSNDSGISEGLDPAEETAKMETAKQLGDEVMKFMAIRNGINKFNNQAHASEMQSVSITG